MSKFKLSPLNLIQAKHKVMDMFARRDHTLKEIEKKLKSRCDSETLKELLLWASAQSWLPDENKIQEQVVHALGRRKKGQNYINKKLKEMGLKSVKLANEIELEKAIECIQNKWDKSDGDGLNYEERQKLKGKVVRFLLTRGFELNVAQQTYKTFFNNKKER